jgi:hypothetical protein
MRPDPPITQNTTCSAGTVGGTARPTKRLADAGATFRYAARATVRFFPGDVTLHWLPTADLLYRAGIGQGWRDSAAAEPDGYQKADVRSPRRPRCFAASRPDSVPGESGRWSIDINAINRPTGST